MVGGGRGGSFVACLGRLTIDHLSGRSIVPTPTRDTSNIWAGVYVFSVYENYVRETFFYLFPYPLLVSPSALAVCGHHLSLMRYVLGTGAVETAYSFVARLLSQVTAGSLSRRRGRGLPFMSAFPSFAVVGCWGYLDIPVFWIPGPLPLYVYPARGHMKPVL